ncbi:hypothetical protein EJB05_06440, partial [Eragrostis curvula]
MARRDGGKAPTDRARQEEGGSFLLLSLVWPRDSACLSYDSWVVLLQHGYASDMASYKLYYYLVRLRYMIEQRSTMNSAGGVLGSSIGRY